MSLATKDLIHNGIDNIAGHTHHDYQNSSPGGHFYLLDKKTNGGFCFKPGTQPRQAELLNLVDKANYTLAHGTSKYTQETDPATVHRRYVRMTDILRHQTTDGDLRLIPWTTYVPPPVGHILAAKQKVKKGTKTVNKM